MYCVLYRFTFVLQLSSMVADLCHVVLSCFRGEKAPRENPPNGGFFVFSHGYLSPRHTKVRHCSCVAFSPPVCRIFAWWGERSPCENPTKTPFGGFSRGYLSRVRPENTFIRHGINQPPYSCHVCIVLMGLRPSGMFE